MRHTATEVASRDGVKMTGDGKILKLTCLAALFVGLAGLVYGIVLAVGNLIDYDAWATAFDGLLSTVYGVRCAILANVPSNTSKIRSKSLILLLVGAAIAAYLFYAKAGVLVPQLVVAGIIVGLALIALFVSQKIVKDQLRK